MRKSRWFIICIVMFAFMCSCGINNNNESKEVYVYLVRHGQTESNVKGMLVGGGGNYDLTQKGMEDAVALGKTLKDTEFVSVYSSPQGRANETARYILQGAEQESKEIQKVEGFRDIYWGDAEGYTVEAFINERGLEEFPDALGDANDKSFISPINAESKYNFCQRFENALLNVVKENEISGGNVLVVAHSSMAFWMQQEFPELQLGELENTTITILKYDGDMCELIIYNNQPLY